MGFWDRQYQLAPPASPQAYSRFRARAKPQAGLPLTRTEAQPLVPASYSGPVGTDIDQEIPEEYRPGSLMRLMHGDKWAHNQAPPMSASRPGRYQGRGLSPSPYPRVRQASLGLPVGGQVASAATIPRQPSPLRPYAMMEEEAASAWTTPVERTGLTDATPSLGVPAEQPLRTPIGQNYRVPLERPGLPGGYSQAGVDPMTTMQAGRASLPALGGSALPSERRRLLGLQRAMASDLTRQANPLATMTPEQAVAEAEMRGGLSTRVQRATDELGLPQRSPGLLAGIHGPGGALTLAEHTALKKAAMQDAMAGELPSDIGPWRGLGAVSRPPEGAYIPEDVAMLPDPKSTTEALQRREAGDDDVAIKMLDRMRNRSAEKRGGLLPMSERREMIRMKRGGLSPRARDIAMGTGLTPAEQQIAMQGKAYQDRAFSEGLAGLGQVAPPTPEMIDTLGGRIYGNQAGGGLPTRMDAIANTAETRDEFIQRGLREKLGTLEELETEADQRFGRERSWEEFSEGVHESPWYKHNFPWLRGLSEWLAGKMLPPGPPPAEMPPEVEGRLRKIAAGDGPKAEKAAAMLRQIEMRRAQEAPMPSRSGGLPLPGTPG